MSVNPIEDQIRMYAKHLRIPTFGNYEGLLRTVKPDDKFEDILLELMKAETAQRQENQNKRRLKAAAFPYHKILDDLDLSRYNGAITDIFINELASCKFIDEKKNIVMIGNPGRGKTHLAIGLGLKACSLGFNVLFKNAAALSTELLEPIRFTVHIQNMGLKSQSIHQSCHHRCAFKQISPLRERQICRNDYAGSFAPVGDYLEQQLRLVPVKTDVAELIQNKQIGLLYALLQPP